MDEANQRLLSQPSATQQQRGTSISFPPHQPVDDKHNEYREQYELAMKEAHYLRQEVETLSEESDSLRNALKERQHLIDSYNRKTAELGNALKNVQSQLDEESTHRQKSDQTCAQLTEQLQQLQWNEKSMESHISQLQNEKTELASSLKKYKSALKELSDQSNTESNNLLGRLRTVNERTKELQKMLSQRDEQMDALNRRFKEADLELNNARRDCEGMIRVIKSLEKQLNGYRAKEDQLTKRERDAAETMEEAELRKQSALSKAQASMDKLDELHKLLEECKATSTQHEKQTISEVRERLNSQLETKDTEIDRLEQRLGEYRAEKDKAVREVASCRSELSRVSQNYEDEKRQYKQLLEEIRRAFQQKFAVRSEEEKSTQGELDKLKRELADAYSRTEESEKLRNRMESEVEKLQNRLTEASNKIKTIQRSKEEIEKQFRDQKEDFTSRERELLSRLQITQDKHDKQYNLLQRKYEEANLALQNAEEAKEKAIHQLNTTIYKRDTSSQAAISKIKKEAKLVFNESSYLQAELKERENEIDQLREQYNSLYRSYIEVEERANSLQASLDSATEEQLCRSKEVAELISREECHIREIERLRNGLKGYHLYSKENQSGCLKAVTNSAKPRANNEHHSDGVSFYDERSSWAIDERIAKTEADVSTAYHNQM